jgi:SAM-dependent methyltransferase
VSGPFRERQFRLAYPEGIERHYWNRARNHVVRLMAEGVTGAGEIILEVGCGRGIVVDHLRSEGLNCYGVDLAPVDPLASVRKSVFPGVQATDLPAAFRASVSTLLLLDVIEHVEDPVALLKSLLASFHKTANLIVTVPAASELWSNYDAFYGHLRRYDIAMAEELAEAADLELVETRYLFRLLHPPAVILKALGRDRSVELRAPRSIISRVLHELMARICVLDYRILPKGLKGTSLAFICARRPAPGP